MGRARMLDHALASRDGNFQLAAAFTVEVVTVVNILNAAERARQAGKKAKAAALSARVISCSPRIGRSRAHKRGRTGLKQPR